MSKKFYIVNRRGERLDCFVRRDTVTANQLKFSDKSWIFFTTRGEAQATLDDIVAHCRQKQQAKNLRISEG